MSSIPSVEQIVAWHRHPPDKVADELLPPKLDFPYDFPVAGIKESIRFTFTLLAHTSPPFSRGNPRLILGENRRLTLFWSVYEVRVPEPDSDTDAVILYYGFDASQALTLETVEIKKGMYKNGHSWPAWKNIPPRHQSLLLEKLISFRKSLQTN